MTAREYKAYYFRVSYYGRKQRRVCTLCGRGDERTRNGRVCCAACAAKHAAHTAAYKARRKAREKGESE